MITSPLPKFLSGILAVIACSCAPQETSDTSRTTTNGRSQALAIGLNSFSRISYGSDGNLLGCEYDAHDMASIARSKGFSSNTLLTKSATKGAVRKAIVKASSELKKGDTFVISFSGHGGNVTDTNGDEADHLDETWCLYDGQMVDDELASLWTKFQPGVRILVFSDSCHSGSVTKINDPQTQAIQYRDELGKLTKAFTDEELLALRSRPENRNLDKGLPPDRKSEASTKATVVLISGCRDNQESFDGPTNGVFTAMVKEVWDSGKFRGTLPTFWETITDRMPPRQKPNYLVHGAENRKFESLPPWSK